MLSAVSLAAFILGGVVFAILLLLHPAQVFTGYLLVKPLVDRFAEHGVSIGGVTFGYHYVPALVIPSIVLFAALMSGRGFRELPYKGLIIAFLGLNILTFLKEGEYDLWTAGWYIRIIFPFFLYFSIPLFVNGGEKLLRLVHFAAYSGVFPCAMIYLQRLGYIQYNREAEALGSVVYERATGGYADAFSAALPIVISVIFVLCLIEFRKRIGKKQTTLFIILIVYLISLVFTFHRVTYVVVTLIIFMWIFLNKRTGYGLLFAAIGIISLPALIVFVPDFFSDLALFHSDTSNVTVLNSSQDFDIATGALHGRGGIWISLLNSFAEASAMDQLIGIRLATRAPHNDYLRILITNGMVGLVIYLILLCVIGLKSWNIYRYYKNNTEPLLEQFALAAIFIIIFYCLASFTLSISLLSTFTWYLWVSVGIVNFAYASHRKSRMQSSTIPPVEHPAPPRPAPARGRAGRMPFRS